MCKRILLTVLFTILGYALSVVVVDFETLARDLSANGNIFENVVFIIFVCPYCMINFLFYSIGNFLFEWENIVTYLGAVIWFSSFFVKLKYPALFYYFIFIGSFIWNLSILESLQMFLSA